MMRMTSMAATTATSHAAATIVAHAASVIRHHGWPDEEDVQSGRTAIEWMAL